MAITHFHYKAISIFDLDEFRSYQAVIGKRRVLVGINYPPFCATSLVKSDAWRCINIAPRIYVVGKTWVELSPMVAWRCR